MRLRRSDVALRPDTVASVLLGKTHFFEGNFGEAHRPEISIPPWTANGWPVRIAHLRFWIGV
jgi:hypothetical protein